MCSPFKGRAIAAHYFSLFYRLLSVDKIITWNCKIILSLVAFRISRVRTVNDVNRGKTDGSAKTWEEEDRIKGQNWVDRSMPRLTPTKFPTDSQRYFTPFLLPSAGRNNLYTSVSQWNCRGRLFLESTKLNNRPVLSNNIHDWNQFVEIIVFVCGKRCITNVFKQVLLLILHTHTWWTSSISDTFRAQKCCELLAYVTVLIARWNYWILNS